VSSTLESDHACIDSNNVQTNIFEDVSAARDTHQVTVAISSRLREAMALQQYNGWARCDETCSSSHEIKDLDAWPNKN